jgi:hypothetical protein
MTTAITSNKEAIAYALMEAINNVMEEAPFGAVLNSDALEALLDVRDQLLIQAYEASK